MVLNGLKALYKSMKSQGLERVRFQYVHGRVTFDVFFLIDEQPFCLLFGAIQFNLAFEFSVANGFTIIPTLSNEKYRELCAALGLRFDPNNPFSVKAFLEAFDAKIPAHAPAKSRPELISTFRRDVEENEKIYFLMWRNNKIAGTKVTSSNLEKTRRILGQSAFLSCAKRNISSCWTDDPGKRNDPQKLGEFS